MKKLPYRLHDGYLFKDNRSCILEGSFCKQIIRKLHVNGFEGHFGRDKTLAMVADSCYGLKMYKDVDRLVQRCLACQFGKGRSLNTGFYTPLLEPEARWILSWGIDSFFVAVD